MRERPLAQALVLPAVLAACSTAVAYESTPPPAAQTGRSTATVFLLGDGGAATAGRDAVLDHLRAQLREAVDTVAPVAVVYLGDNIYEVGARPTHAAEDREKLAAQIGPGQGIAGVRIFFTPGNHDWGGGAPNDPGSATLRLQREWIDELGGGRAQLVPADGCSGPVTVDVAPSVHLVFIDSEALLRGVGPPCEGADEVYGRLARELQDRRDGRVVLLSHHPLVTGGKHGGQLGFLSGFPTVSWVAAKTGVEVQDLRSGTYRALIDGLEGAFEASESPPLLVASGHEHSLQVIRSPEGGEEWFQLVSGSVAKTSPVSRIDGMRYGTARHGYMRLDFDDAEVRLTVFALSSPGGRVAHVFSCRIASGGELAECPEATLAGGR